MLHVISATARTTTGKIPHNMSIFTLCAGPVNSSGEFVAAEWLSFAILGDVVSEVLVAPSFDERCLIVNTVFVAEMQVATISGDVWDCDLECSQSPRRQRLEWLLYPHGGCHFEL
jgi:hypothetical protein